MIFTQAAFFLIWAFTAIMARVVQSRGAENAFEEQFVDLWGTTQHRRRWVS